MGISAGRNEAESVYRSRRPGRMLEPRPRTKEEIVEEPVNEHSPILGRRRYGPFVEAGRLLVITALVTGVALTLTVVGGIVWWMVTCGNDATSAHCRIG
jgi:hypothetical protein